jgi:signal transduction histidine kinase
MSQGPSSTRGPHLSLVPDGDGKRVGEISTRILWCPSKFVEDHFGIDVLEELATRVGIDAKELERGSAWVRVEQASQFFDGVREIVGDEETFRQACVHRAVDAFGPLRFVLPATTPLTIMKMAAKTMRLVTSAATVEILNEQRNGIRTKYTSFTPEHETRLMCISRMATSASIPTWFGLPTATVKEHACIARGDDACVYDYSFYTRGRWMPPLFGALVGLASAYALVLMGLAAPVLWVCLPMMFALAGAVYEARFTYRTNLMHGEQIQSALRETAENEANARRELLALHQRQRQWARMMEQQVRERTSVLQQVLDTVRKLSEERGTHIRSVSHDLRNPLSVLRANNDFFAQLPLPEEYVQAVEEAIKDGGDAVERMEKMIVALIDSLAHDSNMVRVTPTRIETAPLVDRLRTRARALVFGRDIRVSAFKTREAPPFIETDLLIFERVIDNLLTNAAKYTDEGSIVVEFDGSPGFLTIKVSDTGRGIAPDQIEKIFSARTARSDPRDSTSLGIGLSVVTTLMGQVGGRIEVMSKPGSGTTFWVHFPEQLPPDVLKKQTRKVNDALPEVVTIRSLSS